LQTAYAGKIDKEVKLAEEMQQVWQLTKIHAHFWIALTFGIMAESCITELEILVTIIILIGNMNSCHVARSFLYGLQ
jgi:hypothetical protein